MNDALPTIAGYEVLRRIGRGGMGEVFHAVRLAAGGFRKDVALKRLTVDAAIDGKAVQRFLLEARISARLDHRHVVRVYDLVEHEGTYFMVMELLRGRNLLELARLFRDEGGMPWAPVFDAAAQALEGLGHAHVLADDEGRPLGLVHRDLTPRNLFVCDDGVVKVLDFGIAKLKHSHPSYTTAGNIAGTFEFLSPEQARAGELDARSDLYQLAASVYFCLTGESPHGTGSPIELLSHALSRPPRPLTSRRADVPADAAAVVMKALAIEPLERFQDAASMKAEVERALALGPPGAPTLRSLVARALEEDSPRPSPADLVRTAAARSPERSRQPDAPPRETRPLRADDEPHDDARRGGERAPRGPHDGIERGSDARLRSELHDGASPGIEPQRASDERGSSTRARGELHDEARLGSEPRVPLEPRREDRASDERGSDARVGREQHEGAPLDIEGHRDTDGRGSGARVAREQHEGAPLDIERHRDTDGRGSGARVRGDPDGDARLGVERGSGVAREWHEDARPSVEPHRATRVSDERSSGAHEARVNDANVPVAPRDEAELRAARETHLPATPGWTRRRVLALAAGAALTAGGLGALAGRATFSAPRDPPTWKRRTFRRGTVHHAAFTPNGRDLVFSATWGDEPPNTWLSTADNPEVRSLDLPGQVLLAVSRTGALALLDDVEPLYGFARRGTLTRSALAGGTPRAELESVQAADFGPDGALLVTRWADETTRLEYPVGTVLFESTTAWVSEPRVSPAGDRVAFIYHPGRYDDRGHVVVIDRLGRQTKLSDEFVTIKGLAWSPRGDEVWVTASREDNTRALWALSQARQPRVLARAPSPLTLVDTRGAGALVIRESLDIAVTVAKAGVPQRELSWFDASFGMALSDDGTVALINEGGGDATATDYGAYLRPLDGRPAVRLSGGHALALSPDGKEALVLPSTWDRLLAVPAGAGEPRELVRASGITTAAYTADAAHVLYALAGAKGQEVWRVLSSGGTPEQLTTPGFEWQPAANPLSPDARTLVLTELATGELRALALDGGARPVPIRGALAGDSVVRFSGDGKSLFVTRYDDVPTPVFRIDLASGTRERIATLAPPDLTGIGRISPVVLSADGQVAAFTWRRNLSALFLVDGLAQD